MASALAGGFGMALSPQGPFDGSMFLCCHGSASPVGYTLDGDGFAQQPQPPPPQQQQQQHFSVHAALQRQAYGGGGGGHHGHAHQGSVGQFRYMHNHGPESFSGGSPHGGGGDQAVMSWAPGVIEQGHHGGSDVSRHTVEAAERSADPLLLQQNQPATSPLFSGVSYEPSPTGNNEPAGGGRGAPTSWGAMHTPAQVPMLRELRRQSSLPHLSGAPPIPMPVRMAHTPPLTLSSKQDFLGGGGDSVLHVSGDDSAAAASAAAAAAGGDGDATEAWERERSRFSVRGRRSPPTESRIAAVAFATRNAANVDTAAGGVEQSKSASFSSVTATDDGDAASSASTASAVNVNANPVERSGSAPADAEPTGTSRYSFGSRKQHDVGGGGGGSGGGGGGGLVGAVDVSLGELSLSEQSLDVEGGGAALLGLDANDFAPSGHR